MVAFPCSPECLLDLRVHLRKPLGGLESSCQTSEGVSASLLPSLSRLEVDKEYVVPEVCTCRHHVREAESLWPCKGAGQSPACFVGGTGVSASGTLAVLAAVSAVTEESFWRLSLPDLLLSGMVLCPSEGSACMTHGLSSTVLACESRVHANCTACRETY